jgi:competence protein ComEA
VALPGLLWLGQIRNSTLIDAIGASFATQVRLSLLCGRLAPRQQGSLHMRRLIALLLPALLAPVLAWAEPFNINTADAPSIARELKGIGPAKAEAIVQYRQQHGPFKSLDELALVKGIGPKVLEMNRETIRFDAVRRTPAPGARVAPAAARPAPAAARKPPAAR